MTLKPMMTIALTAIAAALSFALAPAFAQAQPNSSGYRTAAATPHIRDFTVAQVQRVGPGTELDFALTGSPGADVSLQIVGSGRTVRMAETEGRPGTYAGSYTVGSRDRVTAASLVTARMVKDRQAVTASLEQSIVAGAPGPAPGAARIAAFDIAAPDRVRPGDELKLAMTGSPGGKATVAVKGVPQRIALREIDRGVYEGSYTVRRQDRLADGLSATGFLSLSGKESTRPFERQMTGASPRNGREAEDRSRMVQQCSNCGVIQEVKAVEVKGEGNNVVGTIAGGVVGGVLGHQVGGGSGKDLATIAGAVGGAYAGNRVQSKMGRTTQHQAVVRLDNGSLQTVSLADEPAFKVGDQVKVENGAIVRR
ncbi:MAG TPA: glycine zipper 2TM domain-containing protein [Rubrivivax sp.]|nr:glycine zipper 2TM domain-containing protein [Rubrivivax sp.]